MDYRYKNQARRVRVLPRPRQIFEASCLVTLFLLIWCWEPLFHGSLGSPFWTMLMILLVVVYAGGNILMSREGRRSGLEASDGRFWIRTGFKLAATIIALILLVTIGIRASKITEAELEAEITETYPEISQTDVSGGELIE